MENKYRNNRGITLIALVVTIVVLLILAGVSLAMLKGENGIISKAQKSARETRLAKTKETISLEISDAMINESIKGNKTLTDSQLKDIVNKYGEMDEDGDTIHTDDGDLSLKDLINGTTSGGGSSGSTEELEQEVEKLKTTINTLNKQISKLEQEKSDLNAKIAELQERINQLESQLSEANKSKSELEETVSNLRDEITRLNNKIADLTSQLEDKNQQTTENDGTIENLQNQITELQTKIQELETELENKKTELENKDEIIANLENQVKDLQQQIEDSNNEISNKDAIIDSLNSTIESLTNQIESLNEQIDALERRIEELEAKQATGTATVDQVLEGATFSNSNGVGLTGTLTLGKMIGSNVNLTNAGYLLAGQTAYGQNGAKLLGTMTNHGAYTGAQSLGADGSTLYIRIPQGAYLTNTSAGYPEITASIASINNITGYKYTQAQYDANYNNGWNGGVIAADNRANPSSTNYKSGYNAGVSAADNRANPSSTNYKSGYNNGYSAGRQLKYWSGTLTSTSDKRTFRLTTGATESNYYITPYLADLGNGTHTIVSGFYSQQGVSSGGNEWFCITYRTEISRVNHSTFWDMNGTRSDWRNCERPTFPVSKKNTNYVLELWYV